jgi:hypothetical protein
MPGPFVLCACRFCVPFCVGQSLCTALVRCSNGPVSVQCSIFRCSDRRRRGVCETLSRAGRSEKLWSSSTTSTTTMESCTSNETRAHYSQTALGSSAGRVPSRAERAPPRLHGVQRHDSEACIDACSDALWGRTLSPPPSLRDCRRVRMHGA